MGYAHNSKKGSAMKNKMLVLILGIISALLISGCSQLETDVQLTRRIFNGLCSGRQNVQGQIDWEHLTAMGVDVGKTYSGIILEKERADYRKAFFFNISFSFRASGGKLSGFSNWRVKTREGDNAIVATDTPSNKVLLLTLTSEAGKRKLTAMKWQE